MLITKFYNYEAAYRKIKNELNMLMPIKRMMAAIVSIFPMLIFIFIIVVVCHVSLYAKWINIYG